MAGSGRCARPRALLHILAKVNAAVEQGGARDWLRLPPEQRHIRPALLQSSIDRPVVFVIVFACLSGPDP